MGHDRMMHAFTQLTQLDLMGQNTRRFFVIRMLYDSL